MNIIYTISFYTRIFIISLCTITFHYHNNIYADDWTIAVVNDQIITENQFDQYRILMTLFKNPEILNATKYSDERTIVLDKMIQSTFFKEQVKRMSQNISNKEVQQAMHSFAQGNNMSLDQMIYALNNNGITKNTLRDFIESELASQKFYHMLMNEASNNISRAEIDQEIAIQMPQSLKVKVKTFKVSNKIPKDKQIKMLTKLSSHLQNIKKCEDINNQKYSKQYIIEDKNITTNQVYANSIYPTLKVNHPTPILNINGEYQIVMVCNRQIIDLNEDTMAKIKMSIMKKKVDSTLKRYIDLIKSQTYIKIFDK